jgi:hypothetical protein
MRIEKAAHEQIELRISRAKRRDPVVSMYDEGPPMQVNPEMAGLAMSAAPLSKESLEKIRDSIGDRVSIDDIDWRLELGVLERADCDRSCLRIIDGLTFALSDDVNHALAEYALGWARNHFVLIGPTEVVTRLSSVIDISN